MNAITMTANVVTDPKLVELEGGKTLTEFRIANNERIGDTDVLNGFFDVVVFGPQAKRVVDNIKKGERVIVTGRMSHRTFEREDGSKGGRTNLVALSVGLSLEFADAVRVPKTDSES